MINPPPSNSALQTIAGMKFAGQVRICLNGTNMTASYGKTCTAPAAYSGPIPANGVIYVENVKCPPGYSPFTATYPASSECGNAYIHGNYSGQLTVATANDIIIDGNLIHSGEGVLGLVANNFVRVYHPFSTDENSAQTARGDCNSGSNGAGSIKNLQIDAAILAIEHSFIVDHYDCGAGARETDRERRDRDEVPRPGRNHRRQGLHQELQLRRPPALHAAAQLHPARRIGLGGRPDDDRMSGEFSDF